MADDRIPGKQLLSDVQWRPGALMAHQLVFGSNPVDLFGLGAMTRICSLRRISAVEVAHDGAGSQT